MQHLLSSQERNNCPSAEVKNAGAIPSLPQTSSWRGKFIPFVPTVSSMIDECDERERIWKEADVVLFRNVPGQAEENNKKFRSGYPV
jgi:hypothetical protein